MLLFGDDVRSGTVKSNLVLDLDALATSTITMLSNIVSQWNDKSGSSNNVTAAGTQRPTYSATSCNGKPGVSGNGTTNVMLTVANLMADNSDYTMTIVGSANDVSGNSVIAAFGAHMAMQLENNTFTPSRLFQNGLQAAALSQHIVQGQAYIFTIVYRSGVDWIDFYLNGIIVGQSPNGGTYDYTQGLFQLFCFGDTAFGAATVGRALVYNKALSNAQISQNHQALSKAWSIPVETYKNLPFDVFVCNGQSNMPGRNGPIDYLGADLTNSQAYQLGRYGNNNFEIMQAFETLQYPENSFNTVVGLALSFAKAYIAARSRPVLLLPCALGGSGFSNNDWNPGNATYEDMISRLQTVLATHPGATFKGWLWMQGETESVAGWTQVQYSTAFDAMMTDFQSRIAGAASVPIVVGELLIGGNDTTAAIQAALLDTPNRWTNAAYASSVGLVGGVDNVHYTAASERTFGGTFYTSYATKG